MANWTDTAITLLRRLPILPAWIMLMLAVGAVAAHLLTWYTSRHISASRHQYLAVGLAGASLVFFYAVAIVVQHDAALLQPLSRISLAIFLGALIINAPIYRAVVSDIAQWIQAKLRR